MTIEIKPDWWYVAQWLVDRLPSQGPDLAVEYMGMLYRDDQGLIMKYRFRYVRDDKVFDSEDEKAWYAFRPPVDWTAEQCEASCDELIGLMVGEAQVVATRLGKPSPRLTKVPIHAGGDVAGEIVMRQAHTHVQTMAPGGSS